MINIHALVSVSDKSNLRNLKCLEDLGVRFISSGGTAKALRDHHFESVVDVSNYTGMPEMMDGRLKTVHPKTFGGIIADWSKNSHVADAEDHGMDRIAFVVVNFYPFEDDPGIGNIDIGGPTNVRAAAKNWKHCFVLIDPMDYKDLEIFVKESSSFDNLLERTTDFRRHLAQKAFSLCAHYDEMISGWFLDQEEEAAAHA